MLKSVASIRWENKGFSTGLLYIKDKNIVFLLMPSSLDRNLSKLEFVHFPTFKTI